MICSHCGQVVEEGKAFCKNCGAPADTPSAVGAPPPLTVAPPPPPPGPSVAPPAPPSSLTGSGYGGAWGSPQGPPGRRNRGGLIWGIVAAVIIVLAGVGVGVYFGAFRDGDDTAKTTTTLVGSSSTTVGRTTTTRGQTTTTVIGSTTTQTIPVLSTSTSGSTTTDATEDPTEAYLMATDNLIFELDYDDGRIPGLAEEINRTAPNVPEWVRDELETMLDTLDAQDMALAELEVPAGFEESNQWLDEASMHMANRIYATIQGVEAMWDTGTVSSAEDFFNAGRTERDAYREALQRYHGVLPIE